jgi:hypothetical protein
MARLVRDERIDVVEFANWEGFGFLFKRLVTTPAVVRLSTSSKQAQEVDGGPTDREKRWDIRRERWQAKLADALVTHSESHRRAMVAELKIPSARIEVVPLGVDVFPEFARPDRIPGPPTVVYLGRLEHRKGTFELLQAIPRVLESVPNARFVLIGRDRPHCPGGRTHEEFLEQEFPPSVRRQVMLAGQLPEQQVRHWLQTADVSVAPSRYESFGLVFIEAMRWGIPVIGTTAGSIPEVIQDGKSGLLVVPGSPEMLANAMVKILVNPAYGMALGDSGRKRVEDKFSVEHMARQAVALYESVVARRRKVSTGSQ